MSKGDDVVYDVVVPMVGRPSLGCLLDAIAGDDGPAPQRVVPIDDRDKDDQPIVERTPEGIPEPLRVLRSGGHGPAAARNAGWPACSSEWVVFLDDDVMPGPDWGNDLSADLESPVEAVLFDRDGTLIVDVPYNGDPALVQPMPGAAEAIACLRGQGMKIGVISNQSGVGRGLISARDVERVNQRVEALMGRFDTWRICPHRPDTGCECRKPAPGMVLDAAADLGVAPGQCVVVGDVGSDVQAARNAGAGHVLVPTARTLPDEIRDAGTTAADLAAAVDKITPCLGGAS